MTKDAKTIMSKDEAVIEALQNRLAERIAMGDTCGPFIAAIADRDGNILAEAANSVVDSGQSHCHAEGSNLPEQARGRDARRIEPEFTIQGGRIEVKTAFSPICGER